MKDLRVYNIDVFAYLSKGHIDRIDEIQDIAYIWRKDIGIVKLWAADEARIFKDDIHLNDKGTHLFSRLLISKLKLL